jgi:arylsulfatase A-like enzyme
VVILAPKAWRRVSTPKDTTKRSQLRTDRLQYSLRNFPILREVNLPEYDRVYAALLQDLEQRSLLDETLVVTMSEMGRTPRINGGGGRDHWTYCYGMWFAGAGIRGGSVYGSSDAQAAYVRDNPVRTADICATIYECLGIDPHLTVPDRSGRPVPASHGGRPVREILA